MMNLHCIFNLTKYFTEYNLIDWTEFVLPSFTKIGGNLVSINFPKINDQIGETVYIQNYAKGLFR